MSVEQLETSARISTITELRGCNESECWCALGMLRYFSMERRGPFYSPKGIRAVGASFGSSKTFSIRRCIGLSSAHRTVHNGTILNPLIAGFLFMGGGAPDYQLTHLTVGAADMANVGIGRAE